MSGAGPSLREVDAAKAICHSCGVLDECRDYALATRQPFGVWGGMDEQERLSLLDTAAAEVRG